MQSQLKEKTGPSAKSGVKRREFPDIYVILFVFTVLAAIATHFIPGGKFERVTLPNGRQAVDPASFQFIDATPVDWGGFLTAIPRGMQSAGMVVFFTLFIGGLFAVIQRTGIIEVLVARLAHRFSRRGALVLPVLMFPFAVIASLIGTQELALVYVPVILPLMIALGFDSITAAGAALLGTTVGFTAGVLNPINTGLGQTIAHLPLYSGAGLRAVIWVILLFVSVLYIRRYALRVKRDASSSLMYGVEEEQAKRQQYGNQSQVQEVPRFSTRQKAAALTTLVFLAVLVWGMISRGWFMLEMSGLFILMGIAVGLIGGLTLNKICDSFNKGFRAVLVGALIAGVARSVAVMLDQGQVMDTIVWGLGHLVGSLPSTVSALGMFFSQTLFNFLVPSGSGQALVTMPIMAPLADTLHITRQISVLAYQLGDGFTNIIYPTSGYFMATLVLAGVPWQRWTKFFLPLLAIWISIASVILVIAQAIGWQG